MKEESMKKKLLLVLTLSVSFVPAAFAVETSSSLGQIDKISGYDGRGLACGRKYVDKATVSQGSQKTVSVGARNSTVGN
jgi:hypothetical protein